MKLTEKEYTIEIESNPNNLLTVEEFVNFFAMEFGLDESKIQNLLLSITEATTNAIIHGNKSDINKKVSITAIDEDNSIKIKIKDQGKGFDPEAIPDPTTPENILKDSGRGLYLMRVFMDKVDFNMTPDGTETTLVVKKN